MIWDDTGFLLSKHRYNENSLINEIYTKNHGKISGLIFGGTSKKIKNYLQTGNELFLNYISCFIRKEKPLKEYDFQYKVHMYNIHKKYLTELRESNKIVDKKVIIDYVNSLHPAQQMFVINYKYNDNNVNNSEEI